MKKGNERFCRNNFEKICVGLKVRYFNKNILRQSFPSKSNQTNFSFTTANFLWINRKLFSMDSNDLLVQKKRENPSCSITTIFDEKDFGF